MQRGVRTHQHVRYQKRKSYQVFADSSRGSEPKTGRNKQFIMIGCTTVPTAADAKVMAKVRFLLEINGKRCNAWNIHQLIGDRFPA